MIRIFVAFYLFLFLPVSLADFTGDRPIYLATGDQFPFSLMRLASLPQSAEIMPTGSFAYGVVSSWSNTVNYREDLLYLDAETLNNMVYFSWSPLQRVQLDFAAPIITRRSGVLDKPIRNWHDFFGLPQGARNVIDDNRFGIETRTDDNGIFSIDSSGNSLGNTSLGVSRIGAKFGLFSASQTSDTIAIEPIDFSVRAALGLPALNTDFGQQSLDVEIGLLTSFSLNVFRFEFGTIDMGLSGLGLTDSSIRDRNGTTLRYHNNRLVFFSYLSSPELGHSSAFVGTLLSSPQIDNVELLDSATAYFDFGMKYNWQNLRITLVVRENTAHSTITTDISFMLNCEVRT